MRPVFSFSAYRTRGGSLHETNLRTPTGTPDADACRNQMNQHQTTRTSRRKSPLLVSLTSLALGASAVAGTAPDAAATLPSKAPTSVFDEIWGLAVLYKDDTNPYLQEFKLRGRYQGQDYKVDADQGSDSDWEDRRSRIGFDAKLFQKRVDVRLDFQSNDGFRDAYDGVVDAYVSFKATDDLVLSVGRMKPFIGYYDWLQSTNTQPTFERSQIFNQLNVDRATGIALEGKAGRFNWQAGVYSNSVDPDRTTFEDAFGKFNAGISTALGAGYDLAKNFGLKKALVHVNWLHNERDADSNVLTRYDDILSATLFLQDGAWSLVAEGFHASGGLGADEDVFGGFLQGTYDVVPKRFQLVSRYSFAFGDGPTSVRRQSRYESAVVNGRGDTYHAFYLGARYFIYGDKLKLLAGAEYATLDGEPVAREYDGITYLAGVRLSF
jgi:phosphate-selective porin OprO and OprP